MAPSDDFPIIPLDHGCRIHLHLQPRASTTELAGRHGNAIKLRVAAPPVDGAANAALIRFLAGLFGVPRGAVTLVRGQGSRTKTIEIRGVEAAEAARRLGIEPLAPGDPPR